MGRYREQPEFQFEPDRPRQGRSAALVRRWGPVALLVMAVAGAGVYLYLRPASAPGWLRATGVLPSPGPTVVYRWRDRQGAWQITDRPPPAGVPHERIEYDHDTNVLPVPPGIEHRP